MSAWKDNERKLARMFGTERTPLSGGNSRHTRSDTLHPKIFFEMKHGKSVPRTREAIEKLFAQTNEEAIAEKKIPVLALHSLGSREVMLWLRLADYADVGASENTLISVFAWASEKKERGVSK